jgi:hypothetical protein
MIKLMVKRYWEVMFVQSDLVNLDGSLDHLPRFVFFVDNSCINIYSTKSDILPVLDCVFRKLTIFSDIPK